MDKSIDVLGILVGLVTTLLNYIFINSISQASQKQTVQDLKLDLQQIRQDVLNDLKEVKQTLTTQNQTLIAQMKENAAETMSQVKESARENAEKA